MKNKGGKNIFIFLLIPGTIFLVFFCFPNKLNASDSSVVINQILISADEGSKYEWIELFNNSEEDIDLANFSLKKKTKSGVESNLVSKSKFFGIIKARSYFLIIHPSVGLPYDLKYSGSSYSISDNSTILLYDNGGLLLDKVGWGEASDFENIPTANPEPSVSLGRTEPGLDTDNNSIDFVLQKNPSPNNSSSSPHVLLPVCGNGKLEENEECDDGNNSAKDGCDPYCAIEIIETQEIGKDFDQEEGDIKYYFLGDIVINELVSDPRDGEDEWVELYNTRNEVISISSWIVIEGSGKETILDGSIEPYGYIVVEKPKGNLNNSGDLVELRDSGNALIDRIVYGDWDDGTVQDNAPSAKDPNSLARKIDGYNSNNNSKDLVISNTITKGESNIITSELVNESLSVYNYEHKKNFDLSQEIIISEIFPNPIGDDNEGEFIELYNTGSRPVNLDSWFISDNSAKKYILKEMIEPSKYLVIMRSVSGIALNNTSDSVSLHHPESDAALIKVEYHSAQEGMSYVNTYNTENPGDFSDPWLWTNIITKGEINQVERVNHPPEIDFSIPDTAIVGEVIIFDSTDTVDIDGNELTFFWDFGDNASNTLPNPQHIYFVAGEYKVMLSVSDGIDEVETSKIILIKNKEDKGIIIETDIDQCPGKVVINEFIPNPEGSDTDNEWIELKNVSTCSVNLKGWLLDDQEGGSRNYEIKNDWILEPDDFAVISREESGIALNNSGDMVRLLNSSNELVDMVEYEKAPEKLSFSSHEGSWDWTVVTTPGEENIIQLANQNAEEIKKDTVETNDDIIISTSLENIKEFDIGDKLRASGTVAVLPGVLGSQYFYIVGSPGIQVYNYNKDFPEFSVGDVVEVNGELAFSNNEYRIKTKTNEDIKFIAKDDAPIATSCNIVEVDETRVGELLKVSGEVVEKRGSSVYVDDGTDELLIYIKRATGIEVGMFKEGKEIDVIGILSRTKSGIRLMPRSMDDIEIKDLPEKGQVLGVVAGEESWNLPVRESRIEIFKYFLVTTLIILVGLIILLIRVRKSYAN